MTHLANISHHQDHQDRGRDNEATYDKIIKNDLAWVRCVAALYRCTCQECCAGIHPQILLARCKAPHVHTSKMRARSPSSCALTAPQKCEYMALPCRRAPYRAPPRPYAAATVRAPQPKVKDEKPPGGAFTRDEERPPCRPLPSAACHGALFSPVGSMARR